MKRMEKVMKQTGETVPHSVNAQINGMNSTINEMKEEGESKFGKMDERSAVPEERLNKLEDPGSINVTEYKRRETPEGRSATFRVQGLGFFFSSFSFLFLFFFFSRVLNICFFWGASIAARFLVTFLKKNQNFEPSWDVPFGCLFFFIL